MINSNLSRRALFGKIFSKLRQNTLSTDPLFEKYSRKTYSGRRSSSLLYKERTSFGNKTSNIEDRVNPVTSGLVPYTGQWTTVEALHLVKRIGFGFKKSQVDVLTAKTFNAAVNAVLNVDNTPPPPPINYYQNQEIDAGGIPYGADWSNNAIDDYVVGMSTNVNRAEGLKAWQFNLAVNQDVTIKEKMVLFWYHFIPIDFDAVENSEKAFSLTNSARICFKYMKMFRDNPTGNFKTLIRKMATQPAMMFYLNNEANTKTAPDENFAREIMELFTLGKDATATYTQADVIQAAKVLTGWRVENLNTSNESTVFRPELHDESIKIFSTFFADTVIPNSGAAELDLFIDMIFKKEKIVSEYICRRLYRFFVYYDIDANIEANIIVPLAQHFVANNWNIAPVLDKLFKSQHFFDLANRGVYIKSPFDLLIGTIRNFNLDMMPSNPNNFGAQYKILEIFNAACFTINQGFGKVNNVAGWTAFYQNPKFHEYWINSDSIQQRFAYINLLFNGFNIDWNGADTRIEIDCIAFVKQFPNNIISNPNLLVAECIKYLLPISLSAFQLEIIKKQTLLTGQTTDGYWSGAWASYISNPTNEQDLSTVRIRLKTLLNTIVQYAEYQLT